MNTTCILCGATDNFELVSEQVRDSDQHSVVKCQGCGHIQLTPLPSPSENSLFYDRDQPAKSLGVPTDLEYLRRLKEWDTKRRVKFLQDVPKDSRILEVGSGEGFFLDEMFRHGYNITGVEISQVKRDIIHQVTKAPVLDVNLLDSTPDLGKFGMIIMFHLIEHLTDPIGFCRKLNQYLADDGTLVLELPNLDDLLLGTCPEYRAFWWQRAHISYFNEDSIRYVLNKAGFNITHLSGVQRYGLENMIKWMVKGEPQLDTPSHETKRLYRWLEDYHKACLELTKQSDTLMVMARRNK